MNVWTVDGTFKPNNKTKECSSEISLKMKKNRSHEDGPDGPGTENQKRSTETQTDDDPRYGGNFRPVFGRRSWHEFGTVTTLHGMQYITHPNFGLVRRGIWAIILLTFTGILVSVVVGNIQTYFNFNVSSIVTVKYVDDLKFPAITICNYNLLRKSYSQKAFGDGVLDVFSVLSPSSGGKGNGFDQSALKDWNVTDEFIKGAHQKENMVIDCVWRSSINCTAANFTQVLTDFGVCYTFNNPKDESETLIVRQTGYDNGLYLRLNLEQYDYFYGSSKGAGFKIMVHKQGEYPFVKQLGFAVSPGFETLVTLKLTELVNMETPYVTHCVSEGYTEGFKYTVETCQALLKMRFIHKQCGCKTSDLPTPSDMLNERFCTYGEILHCVKPAIRAFIDDLKSQGNCSVPCFRQVFTPRISEVFWPAEHISEALQDAFNSSESFLRKNIIDVVIFFEELNYEEIRQVEAYSFPDLLSDIGGYMGLMVGASIITFLEFVDFLIMSVIVYCRKYNILRRKRRRINISESRSSN